MITIPCSSDFYVYQWPAWMQQQRIYVQRLLLVSSSRMVMLLDCVDDIVTSLFLQWTVVSFTTSRHSFSVSLLQHNASRSFFTFYDPMENFFSLRKRNPRLQHPSPRLRNPWKPLRGSELASRRFPVVSQDFSSTRIAWSKFRYSDIARHSLWSLPDASGFCCSSKADRSNSSADSFGYFWSSWWSLH